MGHARCRRSPSSPRRHRRPSDAGQRVRLRRAVLQARPGQRPLPALVHGDGPPARTARRARPRRAVRRRPRPGRPRALPRRLLALPDRAALGPGRRGRPAGLHARARLRPLRARPHDRRRAAAARLLDDRRRGAARRLEGRAGLRAPLQLGADRPLSPQGRCGLAADAGRPGRRERPAQRARSLRAPARVRMDVPGPLRRAGLRPADGRRRHGPRAGDRHDTRRRADHDPAHRPGLRGRQALLRATVPGRRERLPAPFGADPRALLDRASARGRTSASHDLWQARGEGVTYVLRDDGGNRSCHSTAPGGPPETCSILATVPEYAPWPTTRR